MIKLRICQEGAWITWGGPNSNLVYCNGETKGEQTHIQRRPHREGKGCDREGGDRHDEALSHEGPRHAASRPRRPEASRGGTEFSPEPPE